MWRFAIGDLIVEQRIWLEPGADTVYVAWRLEGGANGAAAALSVALLANGRDHHGDTWPPGFSPGIAGGGCDLDCRRAGPVRAADRRHRRLDRRRGASGIAISTCRSSASAGSATATRTSMSAISTCRCHPGNGSASPPGWRRRPRPISTQRWGAGAITTAAVLERALAADPVFAAAPGWVMRLVLAADAFVIARPLPGDPDGQSVIAGYPWFGDWGRDTMISLPGLCLATGRFDTARLILETFARFVDRGMLPNVFPGAGGNPRIQHRRRQPVVHRGVARLCRGDRRRGGLAPGLPGAGRDRRRHVRGTRYGIAVDPADGLLRAGEPGVQLTWMDARVGDWVVTPRIGKPVEINALWYNALVAMAAMAERIGAPAASYRTRRRGRSTGSRALCDREARAFTTSSTARTATMRACGRTRFLPSACRRPRSTRQRSARCWHAAAGHC